jgi:hypothetical protein
MTKVEYRQFKQKKAEAEARKLAIAQILNTAKAEEKEHERVGRLGQVRFFRYYHTDQELKYLISKNLLPYEERLDTSLMKKSVSLKR